MHYWLNFLTSLIGLKSPLTFKKYHIYLSFLDAGRKRSISGSEISEVAPKKMKPDDETEENKVFSDDVSTSSKVVKLTEAVSNLTRNVSPNLLYFCNLY
jgi:hypothetical protein